MFSKFQIFGFPRLFAAFQVSFFRLIVLVVQPAASWWTNCRIQLLKNQIFASGVGWDQKQSKKLSELNIFVKKSSYSASLTSIVWTADVIWAFLPSFLQLNSKL